MSGRPTNKEIECIEILQQKFGRQDDHHKPDTPMDLHNKAEYVRCKPWKVVIRKLCRR